MRPFTLAAALTLLTTAASAQHADADSLSPSRAMISAAASDS